MLYFFQPRRPAEVPQSTTVPPGCSARRMAPSPAAAALRISVVPFSTGLPSQRYTGRLLRNTPSGSSFFRMVTFRHVIKRPAHSRRKDSRKKTRTPRYRGLLRRRGFHERHGCVAFSLSRQLFSGIRPNSFRERHGMDESSLS